MLFLRIGQLSQFRIGGNIDTADANKELCNILVPRIGKFK